MSATFNDDKVDQHIVLLDKLINSADITELYKAHLCSIRDKAKKFRGTYKSAVSVQELEALWTIKQLLDAGHIRV